MNAIQCCNLNKSFGNKKVLDDLNFTLDDKQVIGFVGENGAGKSTFMRILTGLLQPTSGSIYAYGELVKFGHTNSDIGYLQDVPQFYDYMTASEYLRLCCKIKEIDKKKVVDTTERLMDLVGLCECKKQIKTFSRGMRQRLGVAQALVGNPKLLIFDEPTSALDPVGRHDIISIIEKLSKDMTIIFSTHILSDVEQICDRVMFLKNGRIAINDNRENIFLENKKNFKVLIETSHNIQNDEQIVQEIQKLNYIEKADWDINKVILDVNNYSDNIGAIISIFAKKDLIIKKLEVLDTSLDYFFVNYLSKDTKD